MNTKRVLMLNYEFPPLGGGAGNATYYLLKEFSQNKDIKIDLITSSTGQFKVEQFSPNIKIFYLNIGKNANWHHQSYKDLLAYSWLSYRLANQLTKKYQYDLIHAFFGVPSGYIAYKLKNKLKIPYIISLRGSDVPGHNKKFKLVYYFLARIIKNTWQEAEFVIANSHFLKRSAQRTATQKQILVIPNGIDCEKFTPHHPNVTNAKKRINDMQPSKTNTSISRISSDGAGFTPHQHHHNITKVPNKFRILYVGRLNKEKGVVFLLKAFREFSLDKNDVELLLVGDGPLAKKLQKDNQKIKSIQFLGFKRPEVMPKIYAQADVFVLPSTAEGMNNAMLEAMASGLAVIATDTGDAGLILDKTGNIIIKSQNPKDIALAFEYFYKHRHILDKIKAENRRLAKNFSWRQVAYQYFQIYEKIFN